MPGRGSVRIRSSGTAQLIDSVCFFWLAHSRRAMKGHASDADAPRLWLPEQCAGDDNKEGEVVKSSLSFGREAAELGPKLLAVFEELFAASETQRRKESIYFARS